jgi:hypothetical protein
MLSNKDVRKMMPQQQQGGSRNILRGAGGTGEFVIAEDGSTLKVVSSQIDESVMGESQRDSIPQPDHRHTAFSLTQQASAERFLTDTKTRNHDILSKDYESEFA